MRERGRSKNERRERRGMKISDVSVFLSTSNRIDDGYVSALRIITRRSVVHTYWCLFPSKSCSIMKRKSIIPSTVGLMGRGSIRRCSESSRFTNLLGRICWIGIK
jgi:hypothetical protein